MGTQKCTQLHTHTHTYIHTYNYIHIHTRTYIHIHTHTHIHIYTFTHTHIYTYTHDLHTAKDDIHLLSVINYFVFIYTGRFDAHTKSKNITQNCAKYCHPNMLLFVILPC